jgi:hypothetical protein
MSLRQKLYQHCKDNHYEDLSCIIQFAIVNYISSHKSSNDWVYLSPEILNSFIGIGEDNIIELLKFLSEETDAIEKTFTIFCPNHEDKISKGITEEDFEDEEYEIDCNECKEVHSIKDIKNYNIGYEGNKEKIISELKIVNQDIAKEIVILNTNEEHIEKLATIIASRLDVNTQNKEDAQNGIVRVLQSVKDVSGLIAGISGDVADTSNSVKDIVENFTGISSLKDIIN